MTAMLKIGGIQKLYLHLGGGGSSKCQDMQTGGGELCRCERLCINFYNLVPSPQDTCNNYQILPYFHQNIYLVFFVRLFYD